jgi:hypothetical protein
MNQDLNQFLNARAKRRTGNLPLAIGLSLGLHAALVALFVAAASQGVALPPPPSPKAVKQSIQVPDSGTGTDASGPGETPPVDAKPAIQAPLVAQAPHPSSPPAPTRLAPENPSTLHRTRRVHKTRTHRGAKL